MRTTCSSRCVTGKKKTERCDMAQPLPGGFLVLIQSTGGIRKREAGNTDRSLFKTSNLNRFIEGPISAIVQT